MITFSTYLHQRGIEQSQLTQQERDLHYADFRRAYQRAYKQKRKQRTKEVTVSLSLSQHKAFLKEAEKLSVSVPEFLRIATASYLEHTVPPYYPEELRALTTQIRRIGANVNTVCKKIHTHRNMDIEQARYLRQSLEKLMRFLQGIHQNSAL